MKKLTGELYKEFLEALLSAFPSYHSLERMVRFQLDENLSTFGGENSTLVDIVFNLIRWAETQGRLVDLVTGSRIANPRNIELLQFEKHYQSTYLESHDPSISRNLADILSFHKIQSVSFLSGYYDGETLQRMAYEQFELFGKKIYLSQKDIKLVDTNISYSHLDIFLPILDFDIRFAPEREDLFVDSLIGYIINNANIIRCSIENFGSIPAGIGRLKDLEELIIIGRKDVILIPLSVNSLTKLQRLVIRNTSIKGEDLPASVYRLLNLKFLDLSNNEIFSLPSGIFQLQKLEQLNLADNQISSIHPEVFQLRYLEVLILSNNRLSLLPKDVNQLSSLKSLDISRNELKTLPPEIVGLGELHSLYLRGNPLNIPSEILDKIIKNPRIIQNYFSMVKSERKPINEVKLIVVGQGSVGKTSIVERLLSGSYNSDEPKTEGISILKWWVPDLSSDDNKSYIRINIWDFGGQEIMHNMHQFFFTKRSLYLLVLDNRITQEENRVKYWLEIVKFFSKDSPVLIVGNKSDQHPLDIDDKGLQREYPNIIGVLEISAATGAGVEDLKTKLIEQVNRLPHIHDLLPESWFEIKKTLEQLEKDFISYEMFVKICEENEVNDKLSQKNLISFLHDIGVVLCYQDDPRLSENNILNPEWVTSGVYKILNSQRIFHAQGRFGHELLSQILDIKRYPDTKIRFLIDLMRKFELCIPLDEAAEEYLVPDLLSRVEPFIQEEGRKNRLEFQYHYSVLPQTIVSRFLTRMYPFMYEQKVWRFGIVLKWDGNIAVVKAGVEEKRVYIWIYGNETTRRDFLSAIRAVFESIHKEFTQINVSQKVVHPDYADLILDYEELLRFERDGVEEFPKVVDGKTKKLNVSQILKGIRGHSDSVNGKNPIVFNINGNVSDSNIVLGDGNSINNDF